jgi:uncharacterized lipoprotein YmbA
MAKKTIRENEIMTMRGLLISITIIFCIAPFMLTGCAASQPTRFFVLNALEHSQKESLTSCQNNKIFTLGINPINLPHYLDRPQIMTKVNDNEFRLSELNVWAEPLKDTLTRVIAQNLNSVPCADIVIMPKALSKQIIYRLSAEVIRLDGTLVGQAILDVQWSIIEEQTKQVLIAKVSKYREPVLSHDYNALVYAYNRVLDSFSKEIAGSLAPIAQGTSH